MARREVGSGITRYEKPAGEPVTGPTLARFLAEAAARPIWDRRKYIKQFEAALADLTGGGDYDPLDFKQHEDWGWYYHHLIRLDRIVSGRIKRNEARLAALAACEFGQLFTELQIKLVWEKDALAGRASVRGASEGGRTRGSSEKIADKQSELLREYDERVGRGMDPTLARQSAARKSGYSDDHARRLLRGLGR